MILSDPESARSVQDRATQGHFPVQTQDTVKVQTPKLIFY